MAFDDPVPTTTTTTIYTHKIMEPNIIASRGLLQVSARGGAMISQKKFKGNLENTWDSLPSYYVAPPPHLKQVIIVQCTCTYLSSQLNFLMVI